MNIQTTGSVRCTFLALASTALIQSASGDASNSTSVSNSTFSNSTTPLGSPGEGSLPFLIVGVGLLFLFCVGVLLYCGRPWEKREPDPKTAINLAMESSPMVDGEVEVTEEN